MRISVVVADSCPDDAWLDAIINTETAFTAFTDNLSRKKYKVLKSMSAEKLGNTNLGN